MNRENALFRHPKVAPEDVAKTHEVRRVEVIHDPSASFGLPVLAAMSTAMPTAGVPHRCFQPEPLALFALPPKLEGPRLHVSVQHLEWEVDPLEWLRWLAVNDGWRVAMVRTHPSPFGPRYELGTLREVGGVAVVRRTMAMRSGTRLVRCDASTPLPMWSQWHDALWWSLEGFLLGQVSAGTVEELVVHEGPLAGFGLPGSWEARLRVSEDGGAVWMARILRDAQRGAALKVKAQRLDCAPSAEQRRAALWREIREAGARLGAELEAERAEFASLVPGWVGQWQAGQRGERGDGVVVLVQRESQGVAIDYILAAPAAGTEHLDWMRATRALDVAIATTDLRGAEAEVA